MAFDVVSYFLSKKYVEQTAIGLGAVRGKPCTIEKITPIEGGNEITFKWTGDDGTVQRTKMAISDGVGIKDMKIVDEHLIIYLTDGTEIDAGELISGIKTGIWIGSTTPPSDDYVLWIDPSAPEEGIPTADEVDIDSIWT